MTNAPSKAHQRAVRQLLRALDDYLRAHPVGEAFIPPADLELEPGGTVQPDVFVIPPGEDARPRPWQTVTRLLLAVEVLWRHTARHDRITERRLYARVEVPDYWIVDLDARVVERWAPTDERPEVLSERLEWHPAGAAAPFVLDLPAFFADVYGELTDA